MATAFSGNNTVSAKVPSINFDIPPYKNGYANPVYSTDAVDSLKSISEKPGLTDTEIWTDLSLDLHSVNGTTPTEKSAIDNLELQTDTGETATTITLTGSTSLTGVEEEKPKSRWCLCRPKWASIKTFVVIICILQCVNACVVTGYLLAVLTTIEKQFSINSRVSGFVVSSYEIGSLMSVVFVSYFGTHGHAPRWIGLGGLVLGVGSLLFALPNFLHTGHSKNCSTSAYSTCNYNVLELHTSSKGQISYEDITEADAESTASNYVYILIIAQILLGIGGSPLLSLGTAYIDNNAEKSDSALYIAIMYIMMAVGPVCGFLLGAGLLTQYVDPLHPVPNLTSSNPDWIGMWWGGFVLCGFLYILASLPFLCFPRHVGKSKETVPDPTKSTYGRSWKKIPMSIFRLATNSVYIITTIAYCIVMTIVNGFTTFLPKYIETQFRLSPSVASGLTGIVAVPGLCIGIYFGGWVIKRFKLEMKGVSILVIIVNIISGGLLLLFFVVGCSDTPIAGLTTAYEDSAQYNGNLTSSCNAKCHCSMQMQNPLCKEYTVDNYYPICIGNTSYVTPCYAGCSSFTVYNNSTWSGQCSCNTQESSGTTGFCSSECKMLIPFLVLLFIICLAASNNQMPLILVTLRSVAEEEKSFALGVQILLLRLLCYFPAPLIYGTVIDSACILWNSYDSTTEKKGSGSCDVYDLKRFRLRFAGVSAILMAGGLVFTFLVWWCIRRRFSYSPPVTMSEMVQRRAEAEGGNLHIGPNKDLPMRSWVSDDSLYSKPRQMKKHRKTFSC